MPDEQAWFGYQVSGAELGADSVEMIRRRCYRGRAARTRRVHQLSHHSSHCAGHHMLTGFVLASSFAAGTATPPFHKGGQWDANILCSVQDESQEWQGQKSKPDGTATRLYPAGPPFLTTDQDVVGRGTIQIVSRACKEVQERLHGSKTAWETLRGERVSR